MHGLLAHHLCNTRVWSTLPHAAVPARSEAVLQGHDHAMELLLDVGAPLGMDQPRACAALCQAVVAGDMACLRRLLRAGARGSSSGLDGMTPLHMAAVEGNLAAVGDGRCNHLACAMTVLTCAWAMS